MDPQEVRNATRPYGGYDRKAATRPDLELTQVGRGTPCGEYLRRFWHPVALAAEVKDLPVPITILGEELVLFRDRMGRLGLLERSCSHRRMSLEFALVVDHGIRCAYHGWHYDVDGGILDVPGEKTPGATARRMHHGAYRTREFRGLVFAYMGPPDEVPEFPSFDFMHHDEEEYLPFAWHNPCNWVQLRENTQDPIHLTFLHSMFGIQQFGDYAYDLPVIQAKETPIGQITTSVRRVKDLYYCRVNELILPNMARVPDGIRLGDAIPENMMGKPGERQAGPMKYARQLPSSHRLGLSTWIVPNDDTHAMHMGWLHLSRAWSEKARADYLATITFGQTGERSYEERHRNPGDWDAWVSQGRIAVTANENLTAADVGIVMFRRQLREGIRAVAEGRTPKGLVHGRGAPVKTYGHALTRPAAPLPEAEDLKQKQLYAAESEELILSHHAPDIERALEPAP
ncbi:Rieske 2Fe-2S domain-containing protein [Ramlibacter sp. AW1]|uniref:Rieske 2Fe-2S domain-containing protein n=1 Tax=Ramlibacter aurantiacus TaxID=2801330 RepID=A0A937D591_9BURK|nr:Rieske 2Fe-2S domain-containing protein [Ramlibacter aurantiacus]MBL0419663.1 Rieske 2Fe-2S domain-containing protein [Ramlibacter aurantiacus]